jgi:hypothetical protein
MSMTLIESKTLGTAAASIEFTSIPADYTDLLMVYSLRTLGAFGFDDSALRINGATTNYSGTRLRTRDGNVSSQADRTDSTTFYEPSGSGATANTFGSGQVYFANYASSVAKSYSVEGFSENNNATEVQGGLVAGLYNSTSPITSISVFSLNANNIAVGSMVSLYGILKGSDGIVTTS